MKTSVKVCLLFIITLILDNLWEHYKSYIPNTQKIDFPLFKVPEYLYWYIWHLMNKVNIMIFVAISSIIVKDTSFIFGRAVINSYLILSLCNIVEYSIYSRRPDFYYMWELLFFASIYLLYTRFKNNGVSS